MSSNENNRNRAFDALKKVGKDKAEEVANKNAKFKRLKKKVKKIEKKAPLSMKAVGALSLMLAKKKAASLKKTFKTGKNSSITVKGSYDPNDKDKTISINFNKEF